MAISTAAAIIGGSVVSGVLGGRAAKKAGRAQQAGAEAGIAEQRRQFDITTGLQRPIFEAGDVARQELLASLGLAGPEAEAGFFERFKETRGQQFLRQQQEKSLLRSGAAIGGLGGGNIRTALQQQAEGRAAGRLGEFQNRLAGIAGAGQTAASQTGQFGQATAGNIAQLQASAGQARASGILGQGQAIQQGLGGAFTGLAQGGFFGGQTPPPPATGFTQESGFITQPKIGPF